MQTYLSTRSIVHAIPFIVTWLSAVLTGLKICENKYPCPNFAQIALPILVMMGPLLFPGFGTSYTNFHVSIKYICSSVVIIYYNIFLPLLLTLLSDNLVLLSPFPPSYYLFALPYWLSIIQRLACSSRVIYKPIIITLRRGRTVKRTALSLSSLSGI